VAMPEASVDEDSLFQRLEHNVRTARNISAVQPIAIP